MSRDHLGQRRGDVEARRRVPEGGALDVGEVGDGRRSRFGYEARLSSAAVALEELGPASASSAMTTAALSSASSISCFLACAAPFSTGSWSDGPVVAPAEGDGGDKEVSFVLLLLSSSSSCRLRVLLGGLEGGLGRCHRRRRRRHVARDTLLGSFLASKGRPRPGVWLSRLRPCPRRRRRGRSSWSGERRTLRSPTRSSAGRLSRRPRAPASCAGGWRRLFFLLCWGRFCFYQKRGEEKKRRRKKVLAKREQKERPFSLVF